MAACRSLRAGVVECSPVRTHAYTRRRRWQRPHTTFLPRLCNRFGMRFKRFTTGTGTVALSRRPLTSKCGVQSVLSRGRFRLMAIRCREISTMQFVARPTRWSVNPRIARSQPAAPAYTCCASGFVKRDVHLLASASASCGSPPSCHHRSRHTTNAIRKAVEMAIAAKILLGHRISAPIAVVSSTLATRASIHHKRIARSNRRRRLFIRPRLGLGPAEDGQTLCQETPAQV